MSTSGFNTKESFSESFLCLERTVVFVNSHCELRKWTEGRVLCSPTQRSLSVSTSLHGSDFHVCMQHCIWCQQESGSVPQAPLSAQSPSSPSVFHTSGENQKGCLFLNGSLISFHNCWQDFVRGPIQVPEAGGCPLSVHWR